MSEITVSGQKIHYIEGEKFDKSRPTVLFIHGAGLSVSCWKSQLDKFGNHPGFNMVALDLPGRGGSEGIGYRSVEEYKDFLFQFIQSLQLESIILVGFSMGGGIAMLLALEHPEIVKACVLVSTGARLKVAEQTLKTVKNDYEAFCELSPHRMFAEDSPDKLKQEFRTELLNTGAEVCYWDLVACDEFDIMSDISRLTMPVLIISAENDILTPVKYGEYLHQNIYGSQFYEIEGSGHFVIQERAEEFNRLVLEFISNNIK